LNTRTQISNNVNQTKYKARSAATSKWMVLLARLGYAIKGVVYIVIGFLAVQLASGNGGKATDQRGAIQTISKLPLGNFLLIVVTIGLVGFALWCFIQALFDAEGKGRDAKGIIARIGYAFVGAAYLILAYGTLRVVMGAASAGKSSTTSTQDFTATLLKQPLGVALVVLVGLIVLAVACYMYYKAYSADFRSKLNLGQLSAQAKKGVILVGRLGYTALGIVFTIIGIFLVVAALQHNPGDAVGLDGALTKLSHQAYGQVLLGIVALGLIAYGIYSFMEARYRRVGR
jgi:hypothetical protein